MYRFWLGWNQYWNPLTLGTWTSEFWTLDSDLSDLLDLCTSAAETLDRLRMYVVHEVVSTYTAVVSSNTSSSPQQVRLRLCEHPHVPPNSLSMHLRGCAQHSLCCVVTTHLKANSSYGVDTSDWAYGVVNHRQLAAVAIWLVTTQTHMSTLPSFSSAAFVIALSSDF